MTAVIPACPPNGQWRPAHGAAHPDPQRRNARHRGGEAVEQLQWRQDLRATAAGARFRVVVDEVLAVEFA